MSNGDYAFHECPSDFDNPSQHKTISATRKRKQVQTLTMKFSIANTTFFSVLIGMAGAVPKTTFDTESVARSLMTDVSARVSANHQEDNHFVFNNVKDDSSHRLGRERWLQATQEDCDAAASVLSEDLDFSVATLDYVSNYLTLFLGFDVNSDCTSSTDNTFMRCILGGPVDGEQEVMDTCDAVGGEVVTSDGDLECVVTSRLSATQTQTLTMQFDFPAALSCIPTTLNGTAIDCAAYVPPAFAEEDLQAIEAGLVASGLDTASCKTGELSEPPPSASSKMLSTSLAAVLVSPVFYILV
jgi:hypothetical protein